ncbi:MAG: PhoX family phosphatase [Betaproteobacteria bacterium]|nr:PhoX family phosphatase [Betaproteobacteria bacterium]
MTDPLSKHHPLSPNGLDDLSRNDSGNVSLEQLLNARLSRRSVLKGGFGLAASSFFGVGMGTAEEAAAAVPSAPFALGFNAVAKSVADALTVPPGYRATVLWRVGDPLHGNIPDYANDGSDSAASFASRAGDHHDGMHYFGLNQAGTAADAANSRRGLLVLNHENITQVFLHTSAEVAAGMPATARVAAQIDKEVNAHGVSVIEVVRAQGGFRVNQDSGWNRRITAASVADLSGPARGDDLMVTRFSPSGVQTRGTLNNCANGYTPWGTYLTCEENWAGYFKTPAPAALSARARTALKRYHGAAAKPGSYGWANPAGGDASGADLYNRWDLTPGTAAASDFRHASNTMGWVVEIDPFNPASTPRKRTALGRFAHEGAMPAKAVAGKPLVYYMGDDARNEYLYKFVSARNWEPADAALGGLVIGDKYLDDGKLYAARFQADGSGEWIELKLGHPAIAAYPAYAFADQADVLIHSRLAADAVGATPMDRPEWTGVHPVTGEVYLTLTNNSQRGKVGGKPLDAANPRYYDDGEGHTGNPNGHILRLRENGGIPAAAFKWDIYLFAAESDQFGNPHINVSGLSDDNDFSSPDGLWFSQAAPGLMWLQTDDGAYTDVSNCMMLAALPGRQGDGAPVEIISRAVPSHGNSDQSVTAPAGKPATPATLRRFLVGPRGCEITGVSETPDGKALFVNIQHPGELTAAADIAHPARFQSCWPGAAGVDRPRSATLVITKEDGGLIGR